MFSSAVQPGLVSLFSSTGSDPLTLFSSHTDSSLSSDSFICLLKDSTSGPTPPPPAVLLSFLDNCTEDKMNPNYVLEQTVLHIQSPTLRTTYVRCPPTPTRSGASYGSGPPSRSDLGMQHPWIHLQIRNLSKEWSFEIGIVDQAGREGIVRCSTFQKQPHMKLADPPLLHLPLSFPASSSNPLTSWCTIALDLPSLLPHFSSANLLRSDENEPDESDEEALSRDRSGPPRTGAGSMLPSGTYSHVSYVKVYATCRLRRIWFSEGGPRQKLPWEFQLYGAD